MNTWTEVDHYFEQHYAHDDEVLAAALADSDTAGLPAYQVSATQGALLALLVQVHGARRILEFGTLGGYSTIWMGRALPPDGDLITLEANPVYAGVARANLTRANLDAAVQVVEGLAVETLPTLDGPFDFFFIDADKANNATYLEWCLQLSRPGSLIVADNIVRDGAVLDADSDDPRVQGIRQFHEMVGAEPRLSGTALQTVGAKGYDGLAILRVLS